MHSYFIARCTVYTDCLDGRTALLKLLVPHCIDTPGQAEYTANSQWRPLFAHERWSHLPTAFIYSSKFSLESNFHVPTYLADIAANSLQFNRKKNTISIQQRYTSGFVSICRFGEESI